MYINRMKNWWLRTCAHLQKKYFKNLWFSFFSFDFCTDIILKQINKIKEVIFFVFFHFSFFSVLSRYVSPLCFPIVVPIALPRRWVGVLEPTVEKIDDLGLVPIFKKKSKICDFHFFLRFMYRHYFKAITWNKKVNIFLFFFHFSFFSVISHFFPRCASLLASLLYYSVVHPTAAPQGLQRRPGTARIHFPPTRARVGAKRSPRLVALGSPPRGDTTGDTTGRQNAKQNGKMKTKKDRKIISINVKCI